MENLLPTNIAMIKGALVRIDSDIIHRKIYFIEVEYKKDKVTGKMRYTDKSVGIKLDYSLYEHDSQKRISVQKFNKYDHTFYTQLLKATKTKSMNWANGWPQEIINVPVTGYGSFDLKQ